MLIEKCVRCGGGLHIDENDWGKCLRCGVSYNPDDRKLYGDFLEETAEMSEEERAFVWAKRCYDEGDFAQAYEAYRWCKDPLFGKDDRRYAFMKLRLLCRDFRRDEAGSIDWKVVEKYCKDPSNWIMIDSSLHPYLYAFHKWAMACIRVDEIQRKIEWCIQEIERGEKNKEDLKAYQANFSKTFDYFVDSALGKMVLLCFAVCCIGAFVIGGAFFSNLPHSMDTFAEALPSTLLFCAIWVASGAMIVYHMKPSVRSLRKSIDNSRERLEGEIRQYRTELARAQAAEFDALRGMERNPLPEEYCTCSLAMEHPHKKIS